ncbi:hypothetical protein GCM10010981_16270 [Dyella nitratireducens]|uniref:Uncharacterized protein n=1 Tax=Dyella nitratireducens TaxID=1849580 RepID=A0ABQ1FRP2_9GAMM|nr:hypothetical protein GCM10010981_16270 [Dyella nitratireducens]GLQ43309.1 hypothetical protein GCM10007902_31590 [Dyella nitratireducens]
MLKQRIGQRFLGREELIQRADRRASARGYFRHRGAFVTFFDEARACRFQQGGDAFMTALALRTAAKLG